MAFITRFLEASERPTRAGGAAELESVARNLENVLNMKEGCGTALPDQGLGGYLARRATQAQVEALRAEIHEEIERCEPRLREITTRPLGRDAQGWLHFEVIGTL